MSHTGYNKELKSLARTNRKNMTRHEKHLWYDFLSGYEIKFVKQRPIDGYIVDFYCDKAKLAVELDGSQHFTENGEEYDKNRTKIIEKYGVEVIRFTNMQVDEDFEAVCIAIDAKVKERMGRML